MVTVISSIIMEDLCEAARSSSICEKMIARIKEIRMVDEDVRDITREDVDWEFKRFTFRQRNELWTFFEGRLKTLRDEKVKQRTNLLAQYSIPREGKKLVEDQPNFRKQNCSRIAQNVH